MDSTLNTGLSGGIPEIIYRFQLFSDFNQLLLEQPRQLIENRRTGLKIFPVS